MKLPIILDIIRDTPSGRERIQRVSLGPGRYAVGRSPEASIRLDHPDISRTHLLLDVDGGGITVTDNASTNGTWIGSERVTRQPWTGAEPVVVPHFQIRWVGDQAPVQREAPRRAGGLQPTASKVVEFEEAGRPAESHGFADTVFQGPVVSAAQIMRSGYFHGETEYLALGGGLGSFIWVDHLRIFGVPASAIRVIGADDTCYANYLRYCRNSQIPLHERLRSNSISTPDNIWGFPGYASREAWSEVKAGRLSGLSHIWDVFGEPAIRVSYTPRAGDVFVSIDREAQRIDWGSMFSTGRILGMRKTDDGRYAVAWRQLGGNGQGRRDHVTLARIVHVAVGYPATRFTPELEAYKANPEFRDDQGLVVNAYDPHDHLYAEIERSGRPETVLVRGRGIVASRILQRLAEARAWNPRVTILHQMRGPVPADKASRWASARRIAINDVEHQAFNWPKACWSGDLRREIEQAPEAKRSAMYAALGGTTTAVRRDWLALVNDGLHEGWYKKVFGNISAMAPTGPADDRKVLATMKLGGGREEQIAVDYVVDCTGLIANPDESSFLRDLISTYGLRRNRVGTPGGAQRLAGISVTNDFEIDGLRNEPGRVYAAGTITGNGPYAAVDSFLGLAYAALRSVDHLQALRAPHLAGLGPMRSFRQWLRWCGGRSPD